MVYCRYFLSMLMALILLSCSPSTRRPESDAPVDPELAHRQAQAKIIQRLTDKTLLSLATRNYGQLAELVDPALANQPESRRVAFGREVAVRLVGQRAFTIVFSRWDVQYLQVIFSNELLNASAHIEVEVLQEISHDPLRENIPLYFHRSSRSSPWLLDINPPQEASTN